MQKHVSLVDLVKSFPTNIFLQYLASIQKRTSRIKFAHLAETSEKGSISNLSTKVPNVRVWIGAGDKKVGNTFNPNTDVGYLDESGAFFAGAGGNTIKLSSENHGGD